MFLWKPFNKMPYGFIGIAYLNKTEKAWSNEWNCKFGDNRSEYFVTISENPGPIVSIPHIKRVFISMLLKVRGLGAAVLCFRSVWNITQCSWFSHVKECLFLYCYCNLLLNANYVRNCVNSFICIISLDLYNYSIKQILLSSSFIDNRNWGLESLTPLSPVAGKRWARSHTRWDLLCFPPYCPSFHCSAYFSSEMTESLPDVRHCTQD